MSGVLAKCCCGKCFFGIRSADPQDDDYDDFVACRHNTSETLELKIPRPAHESGITQTGIIDQGNCPCCGTYRQYQSCDKQDTIEVDYKHFQYNDSTRVYTWFYQKDDLWPPPINACCGYDGTCPPDSNDALCIDPGPDYCYQGCASGGNGDWRMQNGAYATRLQRDLIVDGFGPAKTGGSFGNRVAKCEYGESYFWLQGIADHNKNKKYKHWYYDTFFNEVKQADDRTLEMTLLCVFHKEKWWVRDYNSLNHDPDDDSSPPDGSTDDQSSSSRTPKYWVFGCSGIPLYSWEVKELSSLTPTQQDDLITKIALDQPVPESYLDTLEADGILEVKDYDRTDGKIIKKTLKDNSGSTAIEYFFARPGGWTFVCQDFAQDPEAALSNWPQIARRSRHQSNPPYPFGSSGCFTGAPIPSECECKSVKISPNPAGCPDSCNTCGDGSNLPDGCDPGVSTGCSDVPGECTPDMIWGNCKGCWIQYVLYATTASSIGPPQACKGVFNSYLCRVPADDTCDFGLLPDEVHHFAPSGLSDFLRNNPNDPGSLCCEGQGLTKCGPILCPAKTPVSDEECDEPPDWGPCIEDPDDPNCGNSPGQGP